MDASTLPTRTKIFTLAGVMLGLLLAALDQTIVATAGPSIQRDLHIEPSLYTWITTSYLVASTVMVPIWGKLSDTFGRRRIILMGIGVFLIGSVLCGVAGSATQLIVFRAVQGLGSASLFTSAFAVIADLFPPQDRAKWQGLFGAVFGLSSVVGPLVGGFITDNLGWHWCFFVNIPVGAVAVGVILAKMPPLAPEATTKASIDVIGSLALAVGVVPLLLALSLGKVEVRAGETGWPWGSWQIITMFAVALVGLASFVALEARARDPIVDLQLFKIRAFALGNLATFAAGLTFLGAIVFLPLFMVNVVGASATSSGLTTVPLTFGIIGGNIVSGNLVSKTGKYKAFLVGAVAIAGAAFAILAFTLSPETTRLDASWKMFLVGVGLGPSIPLYNLVIQSAVPPQVIGSATSVATFSRQIGATVGLALLGTVFATTLSSAMAEELAKATEGAPPQMLAQLQGPATTGEETPRAAFDREATEQRVRDNFAKLREVTTKALEGDEAAQSALAADPGTDPRLKALVTGEVTGEAARAIDLAFDDMKASVRGAIEQGPEAVAAIAKDPRLPPALAQSLTQTPPAALADPATRAPIIRGIEADLDAARERAKANARTAALEGAQQALTQAESTALATVGKVDAAIKLAFSRAIARVFLVSLFLSGFALLTALLIPVIPLRTGKPTTPSE